MEKGRTRHYYKMVRELKSAEPFGSREVRKVFSRIFSECKTNPNWCGELDAAMRNRCRENVNENNRIAKTYYKLVMNVNDYAKKNYTRHEILAHAASFAMCY